MPGTTKETTEMKALEGVKILDFTHVQSGPTCTQLLAWFGADVLKVERPGVGDATRKQLVDVPGADSLYFTMLNHNKRSIELNSKNETGKQVLTRLIEECDVMVENFAPGALDRMGFLRRSLRVYKLVKFTRIGWNFRWIYRNLENTRIGVFTTRSKPCID